MASSEEPKSIPILVCGDVSGKIKLLFKRIAKLNKEKGPFEALYCVGSFFGTDNSDWDLVLSRKLKAPIPCYILGPSKEEHVRYFLNHAGEEIVPNVIYLGKKGILTTASGLKIAYLSGVEDHPSKECSFTAKDVLEMQNNFQALSLRGVDLLLTSQWPRNVAKNHPTENKQLSSLGSELISFLAVTLKPCYHFSGLEEIFFERVPYRNSRVFSEKVSHVTRFIGLGAVGNDKNMQFLYGINHVPLHEASEKLLQQRRMNEVVTECPYQASVLKEGEITKRSNNASFSEPTKRKSTDAQGSRKQAPQRLECWFCLGSKVEEHLIVAVGNDCYVALAKGWLIPEHLLLIPNLHHKSMSHLPDHVLEEIELYKDALRQYFRTRGKFTVFFERHYKSPHMQLQALAVPQRLQGTLEEKFLNAADALNISLEEIPPYSILKQVIGNNKQYFYIEFEARNSCPRKFVHTIQEEFPLEFARSVLAQKSVLNVPHRIDWKNCTESTSEVKHVCEEIRSDFHQFLSSSKIVYNFSN